MIINKTNIKTILEITTSAYDNKIDMLIPLYLDQICEYCNNDFLAKNKYGYIYEYLNAVITTTTITLTTTLNLKAGDFIKLSNTTNNDGIYQIKTFINGIITIETSKSMNAENVSNMKLNLISFPAPIVNILIQQIKNNTLINSNVIKEKIDDVEFDYIEVSNDNFLAKNDNLLGQYRRLYKGC